MRPESCKSPKRQEMGRRLARNVHSVAWRVKAKNKLAEMRKTNPKATYKQALIALKGTNK